MTTRNYQARGGPARSEMITLRVSPEDRRELQRLASERGETVSRMLLSRWLPEKNRAARKSLANEVRPAASVYGAPQTDVTVPALPTHPIRQSGAGASAMQESLFAALDGE